MQDNEKKPALRFKGFTDPWEQRKLGELGKARSGIVSQMLNKEVRRGYLFTRFLT